MAGYGAPHEHVYYRFEYKYGQDTISVEYPRLEGAYSAYSPTVLWQLETE